MNSADYVVRGVRDFARIVTSKDGAQVVVYRTVCDATDMPALACIAKAGTMCATLWASYEDDESADAAFADVPPELVEAAVCFAMTGAAERSVWGPY